MLFFEDIRAKTKISCSQVDGIICCQSKMLFLAQFFMIFVLCCLCSSLFLHYVKPLFLAVWVTHVEWGYTSAISYQVYCGILLKVSSIKSQDLILGYERDELSLITRSKVKQITVRLNRIIQYFITKALDVHTRGKNQYSLSCFQ